jgi:hypothetical protein
MTPDELTAGPTSATPVGDDFAHLHRALVVVAVAN